MDGLRTLFVTAEDVAGNITHPAQVEIDVLNVFVDTPAPQVFNVFVTDAPGYDLFGPKPSTARPTGVGVQPGYRLHRPAGAD